MMMPIRINSSFPLRKETNYSDAFLAKHPAYISDKKYAELKERFGLENATREELAKCLAKELWGEGRNFGGQIKILLRQQSSNLRERNSKRQQLASRKGKSKHR